jgi:hypothetical protein
MNEDKAAVGLRFSIRATVGANAGDPQSLRNINTTIYPNGAHCFVTDTRTLYELDKSSTATPDNVTIVAAQPAGQGNWLIAGSSPGVASLVEVVGTAANSVTTGGSNFVPITGSAFAFQPAGTPAGWTLTAAGGVLTYHGTETVKVIARATVSVEVTAESGGLVWAAVTQDGNEIGDNPATSFLFGAQESDVGGTGSPGILTAEQTLLLAPGDTLQIILGTTAGSNLNVLRATLSVLIP